MSIELTEIRGESHVLCRALEEPGVAEFEFKKLQQGVRQKASSGVVSVKEVGAHLV